MQPEIEVKFLNLNHDEIRLKLGALGAICEKPMRLMRRAMLDHLDNRLHKDKPAKNLRVRDEGDKVTVTFKSGSDGGQNYSGEAETIVQDFNKMIEIFKLAGLHVYSFQESKRETWVYKNSEVVLDEWPWLNSFIEIEGPDEATIQEIAKDLSFDWQEAKRGSVDTAYCDQYLGMTRNESIADLPEVKFDMPIPDYLKQRMTK